jgi:hypothetical protein
MVELIFVLPKVLTKDAYAAYWDAVRTSFFDPYLDSHTTPPLIVIAHRFVWDLPHFRMMLSTLFETQVIFLQ